MGLRFPNTLKQFETSATAGFKLFPYLILAVFFIAIVLTYKDYGVTWDDPLQARYGELTLQYFASGFKDQSANTYRDLKWYGPFFELLYTVFCKPWPHYKFEIRHFLVALTAIFGFCGLIKYGQLFKNPVIPLFSTLALIMTPRFYADAFYNSKDIPFACLFIWSLWSLARLFLEKSYPWKLVLVSGICAGMTLAARPAGLPLLLFFFFALAAFNFFKEPQGKLSWRSAFKFAALFSIAWLLMVSFWPFAHQNPFLNPLSAIKFALNFSQRMSLLFEGQVILNTQLPWHYLPKYILITTPPAILLFSFVGIFGSIVKLLKAWREQESLPHYLTLIWLFVPLGFFVLTTPTAYGGIRHFLFLLPAIAVFCGLGAVYLLDRITSRKMRRAFSIFFVAAFLIPIKDLVRLHPYQVTYFNFLVGGVRGAYLKYDTDYWALSYKEAAEWVRKQKPSFPDRKIMVLAAGDDFMREGVSHYLGEDGEAVIIDRVNIKGALPSIFDFYIGMNRLGASFNFPESPIVYQVGREGAIFSVIKSNYRSSKEVSGRGLP